MLPAKTLEQTIGAEKQDLESEEQTEETASVAKDAEEPVAEATEESVAKEGELTSKVYSEAEVDKLAKSLADSMTAKSMTTYQKTVEGLQAKIAKFEKAAEEMELARLEGREKEEWGDTPAVGDFQKERRKQNAWIAEIVQKYQSETEKWEAGQKKLNASKSLKLAIEYGLPNGKEIIKQLENFIKEIGEGTEAEMELRALRASLNPKAEKRTTAKPDSNRLSAIGGKDWGKATSEELIVEGRRQDQLKRK